MTEVARRAPGEVGTPEQVMGLIQGIRADLEAVEDPREAVTITKRADAVKYLARKADASAEVQNQASEVALRARRKAGQLLADVPREPGAGGHRFGSAGSHQTEASQRNTPYRKVLEEAQLPKPTAERFQQLAQLPDEKFEQHIAESAADQLTMNAALKKAARERQPEPVTAAVPLPDDVFSCIVIDPPWPMKKIERDERPAQGVELDYPVMSLDEIAKLPVGELSADDCHLYLWVTHKFLPAGLDLLEEWGFSYQCLMTWRKNVGITPFSWMYDTEHALFARRGNLPLARLGLRLSFDAPVTGHSVKPDVFYERVITASPGPRLEMFARRERDGFAAWGNEVSP